MAAINYTINETANMIQQLEDYMARHQVFKNKRLSVTDVAVATSIPAKTLSALINSYYKQRFTDWVNTYRVNYLINLLKAEDWDKHTLEGLATEAGFASRSTFFASFKKITGLTPLEYLKRHIT